MNRSNSALIKRYFGNTSNVHFVVVVFDEDILVHCIFGNKNVDSLK